MNFSHYLPNTEQRIEKLRRIINQRTVAIVVQGYSVTELEERIAEIKDCDICYVSLSAFWVVEKYITGRIGRNLTITQCTPIPGLHLEMDRVASFLDRQEDNMFITAEPSLHQPDMPEWFDRDKFVAKYDDKLLIFDAVWHPHQLWGQVPNPDYPLHFMALCDLTILISLMMIGKASRIVLFGADGGILNPDQPYYRQADLSYRFIHDLPRVEECLNTDANNFNSAMPEILGRVSNTYNLPLPDIVNCSKDSHYSTFRKLSYDETFELLRGSK